MWGGYEIASTQKIFALVLGVVLLLVGILGFISNPLVGSTGYFTTNTTQDILHIIAGLIDIWVGTMGNGLGLTCHLDGLPLSWE